MKKIKTLLLSAMSFSFLLAGCNQNIECINHIDKNGDGHCDICNAEMRKENMDFVGISFKDKQFTYDGENHSIYVDGAPDFATVKYTNNDQKDVGKYKVTARISAEGYNTKTLTAYLTIIGNTFDNITFTDKTVDYDGKYHNLEVDGAPDFATITYSGNNQKDVGKYKVTANISAKGYDTKKLTAYLTIKGKQFKGITFLDQEIQYDGEYHSIYVEGAPEGATVTYSGNNKKEKGTYTVTATISMVGYETLKLTAKMTISPALMPLVEDLVDKTIFYTGHSQLISVTLPDRYGMDVIYKVDGKQVDENKFAVKTIGTHTVSITLKDSYYEKLSDRTTTATIKVVEENVGGVDSSKTAYTINSDTKYKDLRAEILKGNFTVKYEYFDDFDRDKDGIYEESNLSATEMIYVSNGEMFSFTADADDFTNYNYYKHAKIVGDDTLVAYFDNARFDEYNSGKMPKSAFEENFIAYKGLQCIAYLTEDVDGKFANGSQGGHTTTYGTFSIDEAKNMFIGDTNDYNFHPEWNHSEHSRYTIYNIGNTKINMIEEYNAEKIPEVKNLKANHYENGIKYEIYKDEVVAYLDFNSLCLCYLEPKEYIIPAIFDGKPVTSFDQNYYYPYYYDSKEERLSGYTFKVYFNSAGYYQGEYEELGYIKYRTDLWNLASDGAEILCYDEWH